MVETNKNNVVTLDVRPTIQSGKDPFNEIMEAVKKLQDGQTLEIINVFEPIPLINKLEGMGYKSEVLRKEGAVYTYFTKEQVEKPKEKPERSYISDAEEFDRVLESFGDKVKTIDVRHLEMPEPMVKILEELETLEPDTVLFVEHKRIPQYLLAELEDREFSIILKELNDNHVRLLIYRNS